MENIEDTLKYMHLERDPKENLETTPPIDEKIQIPTIWAFEVFPPEYIENFHKSIEKLGWAEEKIDGLDYFQDTLHGMRHRNVGGGWINLGYIIDDSDQQTLPPSKKAKLPNGIKRIRASIFQPTPSTTILICQFFLEDELAGILEEVLKKYYTTHLQKNKKSASFITPSNQKKDSINLNLEFLNSVCSDWLKENFSGLYASDFIEESHPVCNLITLEKNTPFSKDGHYNDYLSILNLKQSYDNWICKEFEGLYLSFSRERDKPRAKLIFSCNIVDVSNNEDLKIYGENKKEAFLNYLQYLDHTLSTWMLSVLLDSYTYKITDLRDSYGKMHKKDTKQSISTLSNLDYQVLQAQKNIIPFISEMKHYCKNDLYFMHDVYEFISSEKKSNQQINLFENIRKSIQFQIKIFEQNQKILKETSVSVREINNLLVSDNLAKTNIKMQKTILFLTWVILFLTLISTISAFIMDEHKEKIRMFFLSLPDDILGLCSFVLLFL